MSDGLAEARRLCAFVALVADAPAPPRTELHWRLHGAIEQAAARAGIDFLAVHLQMLGDGALVVFPAGVNEPRAFAALVKVFRGGLPAEGQVPVRIRLAAAVGLPEAATIEVARLAESPSAHPGAVLDVVLGREGIGA
ncbi:hypothetical protein ABT369_46090 [Dactylosporangium sp. NPDC000244]|uniref:hypothetical protein n=1 Tax=Dactylosporangium sp. NPDC000244 TaxID=3154365 RepID=UPI00332B3C78